MCLTVLSTLLLFVEQEATKSDIWFDVGDIFKVFAGAVIALVLNRFMKSYDTNEKNRDIRRMIVSDLQHQKTQLVDFVSEIDKILPLFDLYQSTNGEQDYTVIINHELSTDIYKSQTKIDLHKAFNEGDFKHLSSVYHTIGWLEDFKLLERLKIFKDKYVQMKKDSLTEHNNVTQNDIVKYCEQEKGFILSLRGNIESKVVEIDSLVMSIYINYKTSLIAEFIPLNLVKSIIKIIVIVIMILMMIIIFYTLTSIPPQK